jgi:hypothetical protein
VAVHFGGGFWGLVSASLFGCSGIVYGASYESGSVMGSSTTDPVIGTILSHFVLYTHKIHKPLMQTGAITEYHRLQTREGRYGSDANNFFAEKRNCNNNEIYTDDSYTFRSYKAICP